MRRAVIAVIILTLLIGLLVPVIGGGRLPWRTPSPVPDASAPPAPTNSPTTVGRADEAPVPSPPLVAPQIPAPAALPRTVFETSFNASSPGFPDDRQSTAWFADGVYHMFARQPDQFVAIAAPISGPVTDVIVTTRFRKVGGPPGGGFGVIVRDQVSGPRDGLNQAGRFYVLEAGDRGDVGIWRREEDHWVDLVPWTPAPAVLVGDATNELMVQASGARLALFVNGVEVAACEDAALEAGGVGIFVGGDLNEVAVSEFVVQVPDTRSDNALATRAAAVTTHTLQAHGRQLH